MAPPPHPPVTAHGVRCGAPAAATVRQPGVAEPLDTDHRQVGDSDWVYPTV